MRWVVAMLLMTFYPVPSWSQGEIFADGFGLGHACRWSQQWPAADCSGAEITVTLPGGVTMVLVRIRAGTFMMGSPADERGRWSDEDLHQVTLTQDYYLGKYEVTQAQWEAVMGTRPWLTYDFGIGPDYPVYYVSWDDVAGPGGFIETLNTFLGTIKFRLPTDAEWERAARAESQTRFSHGDVLECDDHGCDQSCAIHQQYMLYCAELGSKSEPVRHRQPNGYGLFGMHGNVSERVQDWYEGPLGTEPQIDPGGPATGTYRVERGGDWDQYAGECRSASRGWDGLPDDPGLGEVGFRLARSE